MKRNIALMIPLLLILAGCIAVRDFGVYWDKGTLDKALVGAWESSKENGKGVTFTANGSSYDMKFEDDSSSNVARTLMVGNNSFLMTKKAEGDVGGNMIAYVVQGDTFVMFAPNRDKQKEFLAKYPNIPFIVTRTSLTIKELTPDSMKWLEQIASEPQWWTEMQRFERKK